ncbi:hypothetical protein MVEN_01696700 [Mycena venus]|uniref:Uncharacterized protein n=1 Tax=Mycena venus TaxID=2733690 RepID=A0A8H6XP78_9AGAR|nr:hypothetical protein MVEN_01696700 [Mycena venus]
MQRRISVRGAGAGNAGTAGTSGNGHMNGNGKGKGNDVEASAGHRVAEVAGLDGLPIPPTPTQRHLIAQLANILHALGGTGVKCACSSSTMATATPAPPAYVLLTPKVTSGIESRPTMGIGRQGRGGWWRRRAEGRACVRYTYARWGPLIGAARGVHAVERERGSGGWGGIVLDREMLDAVVGFAGYGYGYGTTEGYVGNAYGARNGFGEKYTCGGYMAAASTSAEAYSASTSKPYEIAECAGGWNVVPEGGAYGVKGSETEEDGEMDVGDKTPDDSTRKDCVRGKTRRREGKREVVPESNVAHRTE